MTAVDHREAIMLLNELLAHDWSAMSQLFGTRVPCNGVLARHPTVQVAVDLFTGEATVGLLGILNGLFPPLADGRGRITAVVTDDGQVLAFTETEDP